MSPVTSLNSNLAPLSANCAIILDSMMATTNTNPVDSVNSNDIDKTEVMNKDQRGTQLFMMF
jgi:hypothetical protein